MLYQICNGAVQFADNTILTNINFEIRNTEKIAIVGRNGCGKTTLLKLIAGEIELSKKDSDEDIYIAKAGQPVIGYLKQNAFDDDEVNMETEVRKAFYKLLHMQQEMDILLDKMRTDSSDEVIARFTKLQDAFTYEGGYTFEKEYEVILKKFGFKEEDKKRKLKEFSGGQRTKIAFVKMLLSKPDILLLDEPTNHLDVGTIEWLEGYLKSYPKAVVVVSHDRMFLDQVADVVYEIEYHTAKRYPGNYSAFVKRKRENFEKQKKDYLLQQKEIKRLEALVERFKNKPTKVAMTRSKLKAIEHMDKVEMPAKYDLKTFHANFAPERESVGKVLQVEKLKIGYDLELSEVSFEQKKGQKIGIIGDNGTGKSTLLRTITGQIPSLGGDLKLGSLVDIGYFEQQMAQYSSEKTVLDDFWDEFPMLLRGEIRSALGAFLFSQDEVFKKVSMLSGGEKVRLMLAKICKRRPNFLILDEPTNHMDLVGKETLESMLKNYVGTVLFVSHDRYFVKEVADALLIFENGKVIFFQGGYDAYLEEKRNRIEKMQEAGKKLEQKKYDISVNREVAEKQDQKEIEIDSKVEFMRKKEEARTERKRAKAQQELEELEKRISDLKTKMARPEYATDYLKLSEFQVEIEKMEEKQYEMLELL